ncbi:hypothetical protein EBR21_16870 [bacterium]|nr:hypothetical protein [bacterium]
MSPPFWMRDDKISQTITAALAVVGLVAIAVVAIGLKASAESKSRKHMASENAKVKNQSENKPQPLPEQRRKYSGNAVINEWQAFVVYHPSSGITEDSIFLSFKFKPNSSGATEAAKTNSENSENLVQVLGARSLIPILKTTFGDQARGASAAERDQWFFTHPTTLFNTQQTKSLCGRESDADQDESAEICWKPKLTEEYLETLTDFAGDACPQLILKESSQENRIANKLMRSTNFTEQSIKHFATHYLLIPADKVDDEWIARIMSEAKKSLEAELEGQNLEASPEELYASACQAMLLSKEFYSR